MKQITLSIIMILAVAMMATAQKYYTKTGEITFTSKAPLEKIEAENNTATCVIDAATGKMQMAVLIKAFKFEKALMQEHFNENYMESSKYPKAKFSGQIKNISAVDFDKDGTYEISVAGKLTIHGVTKSIAEKGKIIIKNGKIQAKCAFTVALADYNIKIPKVVKDNIAKTVSIDIDLDLKALKKKS